MADDKLLWRVTADQVLEAMQFYNATELKGVQSKLTASATQLDKLTTGPLRCLLAQDEEEVIRRAADLVRQLNLRVEHAKEIKKREEKRKADETKKRSAAVLKVLKDNFEIEQNEGEEFHRRLVSVAEIILTLSKDQQFLVYLPTAELAEEMLVTLQRYSREGDPLPRFAQYLQRNLISGLEDTLFWLSEKTPPAEALRSLLARAAELREGIRQSYKALFEELQRLILIATTDNVERLPAKPAGRR